MLALDYDLGNLLEAHKQNGGGKCLLVLADLDDFHAKVKALRIATIATDGISVLNTVFLRLIESLPEGAVSFRHGQDSVLIAYWGKSLGDLLPELVTWHARFRENQFQIGEETLSLTFTASIGEFPLHADRLTRLLRLLEDSLFRGKTEGKARIVVTHSTSMVIKNSYYTPLQLDRLSSLAKRLGVPEARLLREALDLLLRRYDGQ